MNKYAKGSLRERAGLPAGRQALGNLPKGQVGWYVYVLLCDDGSLYKGKTNNLDRRMNEHFSGVGASEHTKKHKPIKLVHLEAFKTEKEAVEREKYLKSGGGREWLKQLIDLR
jgi:predicted GIY-YIG superfamily endonuclease